jgi:microcystin-dependent protein
MGNPYVGEIRMFGGNFAPAGWAFCEGQLLAISQNDVLFNLIGTTYGGDGQETFALPDLRGRIPIHQGNGFTIAEASGTETVTLTVQQIPVHQHTPVASNDSGAAQSPQNGYWAATAAGTQIYSAPAGVNPMHPQAIAPTGGSQPHENMAPYLCVNFILSLFGVFPSQT